MFTKLKETLFPTPPSAPNYIPELAETDTPIYEQLATERGIDQ